MYAAACFITYATFVLYWYMVYEGNLIPALLLPSSWFIWQQNGAAKAGVKHAVSTHGTSTWHARNLHQHAGEAE